MALEARRFSSSTYALDVQEDEPTQPMDANPVFGRYELIGKLGGGGMGALYLAKQKGPGGFSRDVVLKVMLPDLAGRVPSAGRMFLEEMRVLTGINHDNVVRILDFGEEQQTLYMAMEHLPGVTFLSIWRQLFSQKKLPPTDLVAALVAQACRGLHAAHELRDEHGNPRGLVHRDVTPQNLMCSPEGVVKVIDFGIVWAKDRLVESTATAELRGKLPYMSPEQASSAPLDRRSDIFAVGVILFEFLTGRALFRRDTNVATILAVTQPQVPSLYDLRDDVPPQLDELLHRMLARDPSFRPETAAAVADELDALVGEASGRFTRPEAAARHLVSMGVNLTGPATPHLTERPWFARGARDTIAPPPSPPPPPSSVESTDVRSRRKLESQPTVQVPHPGDALTITPPPAGATAQHVLPDGRRIEIQSITLHEHHPAAVPFTFSAAPALLPTPLLLAPRGSSLFIDVDPRAVFEGGQRPRIYHHASDPNTRCDGFHVPETTEDAGFDVGHRRVRVQRVHCDSAAPSAGSRRVCVHVRSVPVSVVTDEGPKQLAILSSTDPADGATYLVCVSIY